MVTTIIQVYKRRNVKVGGAQLAKINDLLREKGINW